MRHLHPVGPAERFVASGVYSHYEGSTATGTIERWSIHELPDGAQLIRVDDDHRERDGSTVLIEAWRSPEAEGGRIERFDIHALGGSDAPVKEVRATYMLTEAERMSVGISLDKGERQQHEAQLPAGHLISPESLIFAGMEVEELAARGVETPVVGYLPVFIEEQAFHPVTYYQTARFIEEKDITVGSKTYRARGYDQHSKLHEKVTRLWVDAYGILLTYNTSGESHNAVLTEYARRPEPKG